MKLIITASALFISAAVFAGDHSEKLAGDVKSVTEYKYEAKGKAESPVKLSMQAVTSRDYNYRLFNEKGALIEERAMLNDSVILGKKIYSYEKDSLKSESIYEGDVLIEKASYERDKSKRVTAIRFNDSKGLTKSNTFSYNESENSLTWQILNPKNEIYKQFATPQNIYFYNKDGLPSSVDHYTYSNPTTMIKATRSVWSYDDKKRMTGYIDYFKNDSVKIEKQWWYSDEAVADSMLETEYLYSRVLKTTTMYHYDDKGNPVRKIYYIKETNLTEDYSYRYEFDEKGNWIRKVTLLNGKPVQISERKIEYFAAKP